MTDRQFNYSYTTLTCLIVYSFSIFFQNAVKIFHYDPGAHLGGKEKSVIEQAICPENAS